MQQATPSRHLFANLAVADLPRAMKFFEGLGFTFNLKFTNEHGACMVVGEQAAVMLLARPFFGTFTDQQLCDTKTHTEVLLAFTCASRADVDALLEKALAAGGREIKEAIDQGFMYVRRFFDLDGHHWEVVWMDPQAM